MDQEEEFFDPAEGKKPKVHERKGTSVGAARLWLFLVTGGYPGVAWSRTSMMYRLSVLQQLFAGENLIAVERRTLRGPADSEWALFGPPWHQAMADLVEPYSQDWMASIPVSEAPDRELVGFVPPEHTNGPATGETLVVTMLHQAGWWLVDNVNWQRVRFVDVTH